MELSPSFRQTEMGVLPSDWGIARLEDLGTKHRPCIKAGPFGSALTKDTYVTGGYKVYGQEQVIRGDHKYGDYWISLEKYKELENCAVIPGDVLLSLVGTSGKLLIVPEGASPGVINPRLLRLSFHRALVDPVWFKYLFETNQFQSHLESKAQGGTMGVLNAGALRPISIPLPSIHEQRAIAAALSDVDALISGLDQLIAKKRNIKQAAMQQLLTGKTRLPGFEGEWEMKTLSEVFAISTGNSKSAHIASEGNYWVVDMGSVTRDGRLIVSKPTNYPGDFLTIGDLVMPKDDIGGGKIIGRVAIIDSSRIYVLGDHVYLLRAKLGYPHFLNYIINSFGVNAQLRKKVIGSAQLGLSRKSVETQLISYPSIQEQVAIASVLSDMDAELTALEQRRDKTRQLKQGMMQQLLTGQIRLI